MRTPYLYIIESQRFPPHPDQALQVEKRALRFDLE